MLTDWSFLLRNELIFVKILVVLLLLSYKHQGVSCLTLVQSLYYTNLIFLSWTVLQGLFLIYATCESEIQEGEQEYIRVNHAAHCPHI